MKNELFIRNYISKLFWYSFLFTGMTPLNRYLTGRWKIFVLPNKHYNTYTNPEKKKSLSDEKRDKAFSIHAFFAMLWMLTSYIQICWIKDIKKHRKFGYLTLFSFFGHVYGSLNNLISDTEKHNLVNKFILLFSLFRTSYYVLLGVIAVKQRDFKLHLELMTLAFINSLDGAGTIRTVVTLQTWLGYGTVENQTKYKRVGGLSDWSYTWRLMWVGILNFLQRLYIMRFMHNSKIYSLFFWEFNMFIKSLISFIVSYYMNLGSLNALHLSFTWQGTDKLLKMLRESVDDSLG